jgi:hypothetical protein
MSRMKCQKRNVRKEISGKKFQEKLKNFFIRKKGSHFKVFAHNSSIIPEVRKTDSYLSVRNNTTLHISIDGSKKFLVPKTL